VASHSESMSSQWVLAQDHPALKSTVKSIAKVENMLLCVLELFYLYGSVGQHKGVFAMINLLSCA